MNQNMSAIQALMQRVIPHHADQIILEYIAADGEKDVYEIDAKNGKIVLRGNSISSLSLALGQYLKHTAKVNFSWCGCDCTLPEALPVPAPTRQTVEQKYRVYMNYCTLSYTASWWDFDRWEKEIDFMAMNGINMPLCAVGIEGIWYYMLTDIGFTDEQARSFIAGPAFLAWQNMGNLEGFCGGASRDWIDQRIALGKRIIDRVLSLGMHPIQQGFSGYVPTMLTEKYPSSNILMKMPWAGLNATAQLDPTDPLFLELGKKFMATQKRLFGLHGFYAADPFHESQPPVEGDEYLHRVGQTIADLFEQVDPSYVWIMQGWTARRAIAEVVPRSKLVILDINGKKYARTDNLWGLPCVIGTLHNFGGRIRLHGNIDRLALNPYTRAKERGADVVGTGLFMEAIEQNPMFYDLAFDMLTKSDTVDMNEWIADYVYRRYKTKDTSALRAWEILLHGVYAEKSNVVEASSIICARPAIDVKKSGPNRGFAFDYDVGELATAVSLLLDSNAATDGFAFDLMDVTRQYLSDYAYFLYKSVAKSFKEKDKQAFAVRSARFLELLSDVDRLLQHRSEFSLEKWVSDARKCAPTAAQEDLFEYNALVQVTIWGLEESPAIFDYSWREWSGLIGQFYKMRWEFFLGKLSEFLENGTEYSEEDLPLIYGREAWKANDLYSEMADKEIAWIRSRKAFEKAEAGDLRAYVASMLQKYPASSISSDF